MEDKKQQISKGTKVYWTRIHPQICVYDLYDLTVRSVYDTYFVAVDKKSKQSYLFPYDAIDKVVFFDRSVALEVVKEKEGERWWIIIKLWNSIT